MLAVQQHIKEHGLESLSEKFSIIIKRHSEYNNLVLLKYSQIDSPMGNPIVQECRGIILDEDNDWAVVSYGYRKFFNYGEGHAAQIDWSSARVFEKLDGSLMTLYHYDNKWQVASSGTPDAGGEVLGTNTKFKELFWKTWDKVGYTLPKETNCCFMFELMTPYNRIVVRHPEARLVLHGGRNIQTLKELNPIVEAHNHGWECAKTFPLQSWDDVVSASKELNPMENEGYVVCDANYNRVKVKSPQYVAIAHLKDSFTTRRMLEIVRTNEQSEFLQYYPEYSDIFYDIKVRYERLVGQIEGFYEAIKDIEDRKEFANKATTQKYSGTLFGLKFGKVSSIHESLADMNIRHLEKWLGLKSIEL